MAKSSTAILDKTDIQPSDTGMEMLACGSEFTFQPTPCFDYDDDESLPCLGLDENLVYSMGYTLGTLPADIANGANDYCSVLVREIIGSNGFTSFNTLHNNAALYLLGYQEGLRAR
jgi:hypothetical protein